MNKQILKAGDLLNFSQVAIVVPDIIASLAWYNLLGHEDWATDVVSADNTHGAFTGTSFKARLAFNYSVLPGKELELIQLVDGVSGQFEVGRKELSHLGVHVENIEEYIASNDILAKSLLLQISATSHHTGTDRRYRYALIDTIKSLGFITKLIQRVS